MKPGDRVIWFGYELIVVALIYNGNPLAGNYYFRATLNGREDIYALPTPDHDSQFYIPPKRSVGTERSTKKSRSWLRNMKRT